MLDAASGGALADKTPAATRELIENMTSNSQQFGVRSDNSFWQVNEVNGSSLDRRLEDLISLLRQGVMIKTKGVTACGICNGMGHATDSCPTLQEDSIEKVSMDGFPGQPQ